MTARPSVARTLRIQLQSSPSIETRSQSCPDVGHPNRDAEDLAGVAPDDLERHPTLGQRPGGKHSRPQQRKATICRVSASAGIHPTKLLAVPIPPGTRVRNDL